MYISTSGNFAKFDLQIYKLFVNIVMQPIIWLQIEWSTINGEDHSP